MKKIFVDYKKCIACKACEIACAIEHHPTNSLFGIVGDNKTQINVRVLAVEHESFPVSCRHCDPAWCMDACPSGAITRDESTGAVILNPDLCKACAMCAMVCPFDAISFKETHRAKYGREVAYKCDLCVDRLNNDKIPACVEACHTNALTFEEFEPSRHKKAVKNLKVYLMNEEGFPANFEMFREFRKKEFAARRGEK